MIGKSLPEYIFILISIGLLRLVAPISFLRVRSIGDIVLHIRLPAQTVAVTEARSAPHHSYS